MNKLNTISIDLAKNVFQVCIMSSQGRVQKNVSVSRDKLADLIRQQPRSIIAMEACYSSHYWARAFQAMRHQVRLIPAQHVKPFVRGNKNDHNDALAIAEASMRPNIRFVPVKTIEQQDIQSLHRIRERLVRQRTGLVNQTRGLLSEYGIIFPKSYSNFKTRIGLLAIEGHIHLTPLVYAQIKLIVNELDLINLHITKLEKQLNTILNIHPACQLLHSIPGIGVINATALYSAIGNGQQFKRAKDLSVWLGLTPRQYASGEKSTSGSITKRGNRYLRKQLIHGARAYLSFCHDKTDKLSLWVKQLAARRGSCKAIVALANRLARIAWILLHKNERYVQA